MHEPSPPSESATSQPVASSDSPRESRGDTRDACPSCGATRAGLYCSTCGEKRLSAHDHTFVAFVEHSIEGLSHLDNKLFRTLRDLVHPGRFSAAILRGARVKRMKPLQIFFVVNLLYFFVQPYTGFQTFTTLYEAHLINPYGRFVRDLAERREQQSGLDHAHFVKAFDEAGLARAKLLIIAMIPLIAAALALVHLWRRRPFGEHLVLAAEYMTFHLIVFAMLFPFALRGLDATVPRSLSGIDREAVVSSVAVAITWMFFALALRRAFAQSWSTAMVGGLLTTIGCCFALYVYRALLFFVTLATT